MFAEFSSGVKDLPVMGEIVSQTTLTLTRFVLVSTYVIYALNSKISPTNTGLTN